MMMNDAGSVLEVPARRIPVPSSISPQAQAVLARGPVPTPKWPPFEDIEGWRKEVATRDQMVLEMMSQAGEIPGGDCEVTDIVLNDGLKVFDITPPDLDAEDGRIFFEIHGGGFTLGGGELCRIMGCSTAARYAMHTWTVDYRMPPDHPYPASLDDCVSAYRALLEVRPPEQLVVGGGSAGGNLAAALMLRVIDEGLPPPAALILLTPAVDRTHSGDTYETNFGVDSVITTRHTGDIYGHEHDPKNPYLSPIFGNVEAFPPTLLASGTRDLLLSDTVRMHRKLRAHDVTADLHVLEAAPHGFFLGASPEDEDLDREVRRFIEAHCPL
jgi:monoterpene epsilon-lactone hydrolase